MDLVYLNGEFLPKNAAKVSVMDRGFLFGDGVYEVIPVYRGHPFRLTEHLRRLDGSLAAIGLPNPLTDEGWERIFSRLLGGQGGVQGGAQGAREDDAVLYLQITRGAYPTRDHRFPEPLNPTVLAMAWDAKPRDPGIPGTGVRAITGEDDRWLRCQIKATALLGNVLLRQAAADAGAEEILLLREDWVTEGSSTNLFLVLDGTILTPPKTHRILGGITRDLVLELAQDAGIPRVVRPIHREELSRAEEIWLTSSTREVVPVTVLDGHPVGEGTPGPLWRRMDRLFQDYKARWLAGFRHERG